MTETDKSLNSGFNPKLFELLPHRPPMLLINDIAHVSATSSAATTHITPCSPFFIAGKGVPSWIGLEYMGQTAALIAGYQQQQGIIGPHLGFLLGTRAFHTEVDYFIADSELLIQCNEAVVAGEGLARFDCSIMATQKGNAIIAKASLSVFRKALTTPE